jgi:hypothetical protein
MVMQGKWSEETETIANIIYATEMGRRLHEINDHNIHLILQETLDV